MHGSRGRVGIPVSYVSSCAYHTAEVTVHFFQVSEAAMRLPSAKPQKRLCALLDRPTYAADIDLAIQRCVQISHIEQMQLTTEDVTGLQEPFTPCDMLLQHSTVLDLMRSIAAVFKSTQGLPLYEMEEGQPIAAMVRCRLCPHGLRDTIGSHSEAEKLRSQAESKEGEVAALKEALQKHKDQSLMELLQMHTQNESLKHSLGQMQQHLLQMP